MIECIRACTLEIQIIILVSPIVPFFMLLIFFTHVCRGLIEIWKHLLDKTADLAKHKQNVADMLHNQISEMMKQQKRIKETMFKRVSPSYVPVN